MPICPLPAARGHCWEHGRKGQGGQGAHQVLTGHKGSCRAPQAPGRPILHATQPSPQQGTTPHPYLSALLLIFEFCALVSLQQNTEQHSLRMNLLGSCGAGPTAQRETVEKSGLPHGWEDRRWMGSKPRRWSPRKHTCTEPGSPTPSPGLVYRGHVLFGVVSHVHLGYMRCLCRGLGRMDRARLYLSGQEQNINCLDNSHQAARRDCRLRSERPNHTRRSKKNRKLRLVKQQER